MAMGADVSIDRHFIARGREHVFAKTDSNGNVYGATRVRTEFLVRDLK